MDIYAYIYIYIYIYVCMYINTPIYKYCKFLYINRIIEIYMFRYHEDGSKKLNACSSCIFLMVYF